MGNTPKDKITPDVVYQEMYQEMRRFRDYELTAATWYTTILLAFLGYVFQFQDQDLLANGIAKFFISALAALIGFGGIFSIEYVNNSPYAVLA